LLHEKKRKGKENKKEGKKTRALERTHLRHHPLKQMIKKGGKLIDRDKMV